MRCIHALIHERDRRRDRHGELAQIAAGLILAAALTLAQASCGESCAWAGVAISTAALVWTRVAPLLLLGSGTARFLLLGVR